jgi:predicted MFS family arabinose efflux permease
MSGVAALAIAGTAYVTVFLGLGAAGPPLGELLHGQVDTDQRATLLSLQSLLFQITGAGGAVLAGWLTVSRGAGAGFAVAVASMAAGLAMLATMTSRAARDGCGG